MKKLIPVILILAAAGGGAYYYYQSTEVVEKPQVVQATISSGTITEVVQATGTLSAERLVNVGAQVSGIVKEVFADYNSNVKQGQLIARIDPELLQVQVNLQNANVERQKGEIAIQEVQLEDSIKQLERTKQMAEKGLSTQQALDAANLTVKQRQTSLDSARKQLLTAEANLNQAKLNVDYTNIYASVDGVVVERLVDPGTAVQASMTTPQFFRIATDLRTLRLSASVDEAEIGKVRRDMRVEFTVESYPNVTFEGTVDAVRLNATTSNNVVTYPVWINVPNPDLRLRPSMTANVRIVVQTASNVVRIPTGALRFRPTNDMYTALGLTPPAPGQGRALAAGPEGAGRAGAAGAPATATGTPAAGQRQAQAGGTAASAQSGRQALEGGQRPGGETAARNGGQGRTGRGDFANMTPEERQRMMEQFGGGRNGRGGANGAVAGGRGGRGGRAGGQAANANVARIELTGDKIDDMFAPVQTRTTVGQVWKWDEAKKELTSVRVTTGITDGQFSQLVSGDIQVGQQVVSNIIVPISAAQRQQQNQSIFGQQQQRGGFGGPQQGGGGQVGGRGGGGGGGRGGF
jgi:HlyD family secretion protein